MPAASVCNPSVARRGRGVWDRSRACCFRLKSFIDQDLRSSMPALSHKVRGDLVLRFCAKASYGQSYLNRFSQNRAWTSKNALFLSVSREATGHGSAQPPWPAIYLIDDLVQRVFDDAP